jgi:glycosyltransferase involved in cell wall biosynthesis
VSLVSAVFSFRNEEENIPELIRRTTAAFDDAGVDHELIFVNDWSNDRSLELLTAAAVADGRIKIINMARRFGVSPCVLAGFAHTSGDAVVYMDADLQDPPELIPQLVAEWRKGADVVNTTRLTRAGESKAKLWFTRQGYRLIRAASDIDILMDTGDFKLLSRRVVDEVMKLDEYDPFLRGLVRWVGFKQVQIYYDRNARHAGQTHFTWASSSHLRAMVAGITSFSSYPLYISFVLGLLMSACAIVYLAVAYGAESFWGASQGWQSGTAAISLLGGIILVCIGIQSIYISRINREVRRRPNWIVDSVVNLGDIKHQRVRD